MQRPARHPLPSLALRCIVWCLSGLAILASPRALWGAEPPAATAPVAADAKKEEARTHFERAIALFEEEAWDAALVEFLRSREIFPTRSATKDAALCLRKLHRFDEALDLFETFIREFPNLPAEDRALADREIRDLASFVGRIDVRGTEAGATVVIDGRERGSTPLSPVRVNVGTRLLRVSRAGFVPFETQVQVAGGQVAGVQVKLAPLTQGGRLKVVEQTGKVADVVVDNVVAGKTPWEGTLPVGDHTVVLRGTGNLGTQPAGAPVRLNQVTALTLVLEDLDATLRLEPTPAGATVAVDSVAMGRGVWEGRLRAGRHRIEVAFEGFLPFARDLTIAEGKREVVIAQLERDPSSPVWKAANPSRVFLEIDGGPAIVPSLGGDVVASCTGTCSKTLGVGAFIIGHGGYQLGSGLGISIDGGFLTATQRIRQRAMSPTPRGLDPTEGGAGDDQLRLSGVLLGASAGLTRGENFPVVLRLGAGALLGSVRDQRSGHATTKERGLAAMTIPAIGFDFALTETPSARFVYIAPEVRFGVRFGKHFEISAGVQVWILVALSDAKWNDQRPVVPDPRVGEILFGAQSVVGKTVVVLAPGAGLKYAF